MSDSDSNGRKLSHAFSFSPAGYLHNSPSAGQMSISTSPTSGSSSPINSHHLQRRSSSTYSRMALNIYGGNSPASGLSPMPATSSSYTPPKAVSQYAPDRNEVRLSTNYELVAAAKSNETPNLFVMAGAKSLQLMKISNNEISIEGELSTTHSGQGGRNLKFGAILDANFGFQQYGRSIAISTLSGSIHIFNLNRGNRIRTSLTDHSRAVNSVDFSNLNPYSLLSGSQDGTMKIWDLRVKNTKAQVSITGNADAVRGARFSPRSGKTIVSIFDSGVIKKWDIRKPNQYERRLNAHTGPGLTIDWHPELDYIVTGGRDKQIQVWDMSSTASENRVPDHVINTSSPVSKVSWCKGRGNGSIFTTDIASCSLNDDPAIQIWNLSRKYIPRNVIECHTGTVTSLIWKTPKHLVSCSRDKMIVQNDVTLEKESIDNLPLMSVAWNGSSMSDITFISQSKYEYQKGLSTHPSNSTSVHNESGLPTPSSVHQNSFSFGSTPSTNQSSHGQSIGSFTSLSNITESKSFSIPQRSQSYKPTTPQLLRSDSHFRGEQYPSDNITPFIVPAKLDLRDSDREIFDFLSTHYLTSVPDGMDLVSACEYNAAVAASAKKFRDCQTWRSIRASILWQQSEAVEEGSHMNHVSNSSHDIKDDSGHNSSYLTGDESNNYKSRTISALSTEESYSTVDHNRTSLSIPHDSIAPRSGSVSLSSSKRSSFRALSNSERASSTAVAISQIRSRLAAHSNLDIQGLNNKLSEGLKLSTDSGSGSAAYDENAIVDDDDDLPDDRKQVASRSSRSQEGTESPKKPVEIVKGKDADVSVSVEDGDSTINDTEITNVDAEIIGEGEDTKDEAKASPITIRSKRASSSTKTPQQLSAYSFTGMVADFDDEKGLSVSPSRHSPISFRSNNSSYQPRSEIDSKAVSESVSGSYTNSNLIAMARKSFRSNSRVSTKSGLTSLIESAAAADEDKEKTEVEAFRKDNIHNTDHINNGNNTNDNSNNKFDFQTKTAPEMAIEVPWSPAKLIKEICMYSSHQGDIIMCATLALLFYDKYENSITREQVEDWVYSYHEILLRKCLFAGAADVLRTAATYFDVLKTKGQTETSFRTFCNSCGSLILNEEKKQEMMKDPEVEFGFWYCLKCNKTQGNCIYCNEPVKGTAVALMQCGHRGHYGCLHTWFVENNEVECPTGCGTTLIT